MSNSNNAIKKLDELLAYSCNINPQSKIEYTALMTPLYGAVNTYFNGDRTKFREPLKLLRYGLYSDARARNTVIKTNFDLGYNTDFPSYYNDLRKLFYEFPWLTTTNEVFHSAWVIESSEASPTATVTRNTLIDSWIEALSVAPEGELERINSFIDWLEGSLDKSESIFFWESDWKVIDEPTTEEIAKIIFIDRKLKEAVETLNLPVYIPSYI